MRYYRDSVTTLSYEFLKELNKEFELIVIGGWAVWLYTKQLKSKDIDIVVDLSQLSRLKEKYEFVKNERLKKYEFKKGEVQVDVYSSYYSKLGVRAEEIVNQSKVIEGFRVPKLEVLMALKVVAWVSRRGSAKGRKDFLDIISLLSVASGKVSQYIDKKDLEMLIKEVRLTTKIVELRLNNHQVSKLKKWWLEYLGVKVC